jgi:hypothetical protein
MAYFSISESVTAGQKGVAIHTIQEDSAKAEAALGFGLLVSQGTADNGAKRPAAAADVTTKALGFVRRLDGHYDGAADSEFASGEIVPIVRKGRMWVEVEEAVGAGGAVYVRHTANGPLATLGKCRSDADSNNAALLPNAQYKSSTSGAGLAQVEFSLP